MFNFIKWRQGFPAGTSGKETCMPILENWETRVRSLDWEEPLRRAWQPTPAFLPGESPWTEGPGGLQFIGSQRVSPEVESWLKWLNTARPAQAKTHSFMIVSRWCETQGRERTSFLLECRLLQSSCHVKKPKLALWPWERKERGPASPAMMPESSSPSCHLTEATEETPGEASRCCYDAKDSVPNTHISQHYSAGVWEKKDVYWEVDQQGDGGQGSNLPPQSGVQPNCYELEQEGWGEVVLAGRDWRTLELSLLQ